MAAKQATRSTAMQRFIAANPIRRHRCCFIGHIPKRPATKPTK